MKTNVVLCIFILISTISSVSLRGISERWEKQHFGKSSTPSEIQESTVQLMLKRLLPDDHEKFIIEVVPSFRLNHNDVFKISSPKSENDSRVWIVGSSGVAASLGVLHYLKYFCRSHVSWEANQINIPSPLPECYVKIPLLDPFRYYQNVCTSSYSFAWWDWHRWERHIDWMALNGINFPLAFVGQEAIWSKVYAKFNFTKGDLDEHFAGPAFLAWGRMGNLRKWGGPLSDSWHRKTLVLQNQILLRMRQFGMIPILPAFAGHVPSAITRIHPSAKVTRLSPWSHFNDSYTRTYLLDPKDPLFLQLGTTFIQEMIIEFNGTDHYYNCDPLNEMTPTDNSTDYLSDISKNIFKAMIKADSKATWVLQGWMFFNKFWTKNAAKAFLTAVPTGKIIVLDLDAALRPLYDHFDSFFGQPFIFCMLNNYGGVKGMYGDYDILFSKLNTARANHNNTLIGIGLTPEGIDQNYISYDLLLEFGWRNETFDLDEWAENYAVRRYGVDFSEFREAWVLLKESVYQCGMRGCFHGSGNLIQHAPSLKRHLNLWYNTTYVFEAWRLLLSHFPPDHNITGYFFIDNYFIEQPTTENDTTLFLLEENNDKFYEKETYLHDLVDITRQVLQILGNDIITNIKECYKNRSIEGIKSYGAKLLKIFDHLDHLLGTSKDFLLGSWVENAQSWATNEQERKQYLSNSLYQITLWGPKGEIRDYAVKQWNGVVRDYMKPRYSLFIDQLTDCVVNGTKFNQTEFDALIFDKIEKPFADQAEVKYSSTPTGSTLHYVRELYGELYEELFTEKMQMLNKIIFM